MMIEIIIILKLWSIHVNTTLKIVIRYSWFYLIVRGFENADDKVAHEILWRKEYPNIIKDNFTIELRNDANNGVEFHLYERNYGSHQ